MKNLENYGVEALERKEINNIEGGHFYDGMYGEGDQWTGGGSGGGEGTPWYVNFALLIGQLY